MPLTLYRSQHAEALVDALAQALRAHWPADPFVTVPIVVGSRGMERWLRSELTRALGALIGVAFPFPEPAMDGLARLLTGHGAAAQEAYWDRSAASADSWGGVRLTLRVLELLRRHADDPDFTKTTHYLGRDEVVRGRTIRFAIEVADALNRLLHHRGEDALGWMQAPDQAPAPHRWLARLLADLAAEVSDPSLPSIYNILQELKVDLLTPRPAAPLFIFGLSTIGPAQRTRLALLARHAEIHLFMPTPSSVWWADLTRQPLRSSAATADLTLEDLAHQRRQNPLLPAWGEPSRALQAWFESDAVAYLDGAVAPSPEPPAHLLGQLQRWIEVAGELPDAGERVFMFEGDSLVFSSSYNAIRQCEVLRDRLLEAFARDPTLRPSDVLVMTPTIDVFAPLLPVVFGRSVRTASGAETPPIPLLVADRSLAATHPPAEALLRLLQLADERITATKLLSFIELSAVSERFELTDADRHDLRTLITESRLRWAWDAADRRAYDQPELSQNTVLFAMERLAWGVAWPPVEAELGEQRAIVPLPLLTRERVERAGMWVAFLRSLRVILATLQEPGARASWCARLEAALDAVAAAGSKRTEVVLRLREALVPTELQESEAQSLDRDAIVALIEDAFIQKNRGDRPIVGAATLSALEPMRSVPFRIIALLGMEDGAFPRVERLAAWDPYGERRSGELDRRDIDRHLMLEAVLAARDKLWVSWTGFEPKRGHAVPASVLVEELLETVTRLTGASREELVQVEPMQPWSEALFEEGGGQRRAAAREAEKHRGAEVASEGAAPLARVRSFDAAMARAATALAGEPVVAGLAATALGARVAGDGPLPREVSAQALADGIARPQRFLVRDRLGLPLDRSEVELEDREPIVWEKNERDSHLWKWRLRDFAWRLSEPRGGIAEGDVEGLVDTMVAELGGEGSLPLQHGGRRFVRQMVEEVRSVWVGLEAVDALEEAEGGLAPQGPSEPVEVVVDGLTVTGQVRGWRRGAAGIVLELATVASVSPQVALRAWVELLVAQVACGDVAYIRLVTRGDGEEGEVLRWEAPAQETAREVLGELVRAWRRAGEEKVLYLPYVSEALGRKEARGEVAWDGALRGAWDKDAGDAWVSAVFESLDELEDRLEELWEVARGIWGPAHRAMAARKHRIQEVKAAKKAAKQGERGGVKEVGERKRKGKSGGEG